MFGASADAEILVSVLSVAVERASSWSRLEGSIMGHDRLNPHTRVYFSFVELALVCEHALTVAHKVTWIGAEERKHGIAVMRREAWWCGSV